MPRSGSDKTPPERFPAPIMVPGAFAARQHRRTRSVDGADVLTMSWSVGGGARAPAAPLPPARPSPPGLSLDTIERSYASESSDEELPSTPTLEGMVLTEMLYDSDALGTPPRARAGSSSRDGRRAGGSALLEPRRRSVTTTTSGGATAWNAGAALSAAAQPERGTSSSSRAGSSADWSSSNVPGLSGPTSSTPELLGQNAKEKKAFQDNLQERLNSWTVAHRQAWDASDGLSPRPDSLEARSSTSAARGGQNQRKGFGRQRPYPGARISQTDWLRLRARVYGAEEQVAKEWILQQRNSLVPKLADEIISFRVHIITGKSGSGRDLSELSLEAELPGRNDESVRVASLLQRAERARELFPSEKGMMEMCTQWREASQKLERLYLWQTTGQQLRLFKKDCTAYLLPDETKFDRKVGFVNNWTPRLRRLIQYLKKTTEFLANIGLSQYGSDTDSALQLLMRLTNALAERCSSDDKRVRMLNNLTKAVIKCASEGRRWISDEAELARLWQHRLAIVAHVGGAVKPELRPEAWCSDELKVEVRRAAMEEEWAFIQELMLKRDGGVPRDMLGSGLLDLVITVLKDNFQLVTIREDQFLDNGAKQIIKHDLQWVRKACESVQLSATYKVREDQVEALMQRLSQLPAGQGCRLVKFEEQRTSGAGVGPDRTESDPTKERSAFSRRGEGSPVDKFSPTTRSRRRLKDTGKSKSTSSPLSASMGMGLMQSLDSVKDSLTGEGGFTAPSPSVSPPSPNSPEREKLNAGLQRIDSGTDLVAMIDRAGAPVPPSPGARVDRRVGSPQLKRAASDSDMRKTSADAEHDGVTCVLLVPETMSTEEVSSFIRARHIHKPLDRHDDVPFVLAIDEALVPGDMFSTITQTDPLDLLASKTLHVSSGCLAVIGTDIDTLRQNRHAFESEIALDSCVLLSKADGVSIELKEKLGLVSQAALQVATRLLRMAIRSTDRSGALLAESELVWDSMYKLAFEYANLLLNLNMNDSQLGRLMKDCQECYAMHDQLQQEQRIRDEQNQQGEMKRGISIPGAGNMMTQTEAHHGSSSGEREWMTRPIGSGSRDVPRKRLSLRDTKIKLAGSLMGDEFSLLSRSQSQSRPLDQSRSGQFMANSGDHSPGMEALFMTSKAERHMGTAQKEQNEQVALAWKGGKADEKRITECIKMGADPLLVLEERRRRENRIGSCEIPEEVNQNFGGDSALEMLTIVEKPRTLEDYLNEGRITLFVTTHAWLEGTHRNCRLAREIVEKHAGNVVIVEHDVGLAVNSSLKYDLRQTTATYELPQVYFGRDRIGGLDVLRGHESKGQVQTLLQQFLLTKEWNEISYTDLKFGEPLGRGTSGEVFAAQHGGNQYAVKVFRPHEVPHFHTEVALLQQLRHPNVVGFYGAVTLDSAHKCMVMEKCQCSVFNQLHKYGRLRHPDGTAKLNLATRIRWALDAAKGMVFLHDRKLIHRDLKTSNLLISLDKYKTVKLCDFSLARMKDSPKRGTGAGTPGWIPPEELLGQAITTKADVFSFAMILWELLTCEEPFADRLRGPGVSESVQSMRQMEISVQNLRPEIPDNLRQLFNIPEEQWTVLVGLIEKCWKTDAFERPDFAEVKTALEKLLSDLKVSLQKAKESSGSEATSSPTVSPATSGSGATVSPVSSRSGSKTGSSGSSMKIDSIMARSGGAKALHLSPSSAPHRDLDPRVAPVVVADDRTGMDSGWDVGEQHIDGTTS